jgi:hypothetical protein
MRRVEMPAGALKEAVRWRIGYQLLVMKGRNKQYPRGAQQLLTYNH